MYKNICQTGPYTFNTFYSLSTDEHILYSIVASSVTGFAIDASDLRVGQNVLAITFISVSGASRTVITTVTKTQSQGEPG